MKDKIKLLSIAAVFVLLICAGYSILSFKQTDLQSILKRKVLKKIYLLIIMRAEFVPYNMRRRITGQRRFILNLPINIYLIWSLSFRFIMTAII